MTSLSPAHTHREERLEEELQEGRLLKPVAKPYNDRWASFPRIGRPLVMFENADVQALIASRFSRLPARKPMCCNLCGSFARCRKSRASGRNPKPADRRRPDVR